MTGRWWRGVTSRSVVARGRARYTPADPSSRATEARTSDRDLVGYGANPPRVRWPGDASIAISLVVNYEEGSENLLQDGVGRREMTGESPSPLPPDRRDLATESFFEYGSRAGIWRFFRIFGKYGVRATIFACAVALERNPEVARAITAEGHDVRGHGKAWPRLQRTDSTDAGSRVRT